VIAVTGTSGGIQPRFNPRFQLAKANLVAKGFSVLEGDVLHGEHKHVSGTKEQRAAEFVKMWRDPSVAAIIPPWGGELIIEVLPLIDFNELAETPAKWYMGYSDTSALLMSITLLTDTATIHGTNFMDSIAAQHDSLTVCAHQVLQMASGGVFRQSSSECFQSKWTSIDVYPEQPFNCDAPTQWKSLHPCASIEMKGRLIGGCLDIIVHLVGTPYGDVPKFAKRYADDGVILYLENCELTPCRVERALLQMRYAGWFEHLNGIVIGRSSGPDTSEESRLSYVEALTASLKDLGIPVLFDADIGHVPPQMTLVNGAMAEVTYKDGRANVVQTLS
jgi:muramoyltetrapeptide carboxypeptidase LdcA involved in peptidoglycan recycling